MISDQSTTFIAYWVGRAAEFLNHGDLSSALENTLAGTVLLDELEKAVAGEESFKQTFTSVAEFRLYRVLLSTLAGALPAPVILETGVLHGLTSKFILHGLRASEGQLYSIDLPSRFEDGPANQDGYNYTLPKGREPGWVLNDADRERWHYFEGSSRSLLPDVLRAAGPLDVFVHDSEHTYGTMWFELSTAWEGLRDGGVCVCDNIEASPAFFDFCRRVNRVPLVLPSSAADRDERVRFGMIVK
jgi:predicted O-methyltransferase YrrM